LQLPSFENPPLVEVVVGIQFERIPALTSARIGLLWKGFEKEFPNTEDQPPLAPIMERFGQPDLQQISFQIHSGYQAPRVWFINTDKSKLLQVQPDRFIFNWRKADPSDKYPRYSSVKSTFLRNLSCFISFLNTNSLGELNPTYCEVSYINHITTSDCWKQHADFDAIFPAMRHIGQTDEYLRVEQSGFNIVYRIQDESQRAIGRLRIVSEPKYLLNASQPIYQLELTARGYPLGSKDVNGIERFLDVGHREIVQSFASITSAEMHKIWGRNDAATQ